MAGYLSTDPNAGTRMLNSAVNRGAVTNAPANSAVPRGTPVATPAPTTPTPTGSPYTVDQMKAMGWIDANGNYVGPPQFNPNQAPTTTTPPPAPPRIDSPASNLPRGDPAAPVPSTTQPAPTTTPTTTSGGAMPSVTNPKDPGQITAWLQWMATQPGHDPILDTPGGIQYYLNAIQGSGGLTDTNYWKNKATTAAYGGAVGAGSGGGGALGSLASWPFTNTVPTEQQALNMPGVQFAVDMAGNQLQKSAAAQGSLLNSGTQQDLAQLAAQTALGQYYIPLAQLQYQYNQGNFNNLYSLGQLGQNASSINPSPV